MRRGQVFGAELPEAVLFALERAAGFGHAAEARHKVALGDDRQSVDLLNTFLVGF